MPENKTPLPRDPDEPIFGTQPPNPALLTPPTIDAAPYYSDDAVTLYHGNCLELTAWAGADALLTDPPYGRDWQQGSFSGARRPGGHPRRASRSSAGIAGDKDTSVRDAALDVWGGVRPVLVFGDLMLAPPTGTKQVLVYRKPMDSGMRGAMGGRRRDAEAIYMLGRWTSGIGGASSIIASRAPNVGNPSGIVARSGGHPHAKPLDVLAELITMLPVDAVIADPFAGSGSTLVAAKLAGHRAIGIELEERYCEMAARRLTQGVMPF